VDFAKERFLREDFIGLFAATVGQEKSAETVDATVKKLGLKTPVDVEQALKVLEALSATAGVVGLVSKLATARMRATIVMKGLTAAKAR
jgi:hypothetical protein